MELFKKAVGIMTKNNFITATPKSKVSDICIDNDKRRGERYPGCR